MRFRLSTAFCAFLGSLAVYGRPPDPSWLWLPLDEGSGDVATDRSRNGCDGELAQVQWARGEFGTAVCFGGTNASIDVPVPPGFNGATQFTLSVWAWWEGGGRYPNLLSTHHWSPGGLLLFVQDETCSFRMGRPGHRANRPGDAWQETGVPLLSRLPVREWTHLCVVFSQPRITTYVNGRRVAEGAWPYPVEADGFRLGAWSGAVSHRGLLADLRLYREALDAGAVAELATSTARSGTNYEVVRAPPELAASFENRHARMEIDRLGRIVSLRNRHTQRELMAQPRMLVSARLADGREIPARSVSVRRNELTFSFARGQGTAVVAVDEADDFFTFTLRSVAVSNLARMTFVQVPAATAKYHGDMANMLSDDEDGVCLRGFELPLEMSLAGTPPTLRVWTTGLQGWTGWRAGLAAGPKREMPGILQSMARAAGVPTSKRGGPWSLGSEDNRGSYLFADLSIAAVDDWIELARRGGFTHIHLHGWWQTLGHYDINTNLFPRGLDDLRAAVVRIHAAGLKAGMHTLTGCIDAHDAWIGSAANSNLIASARYTLARPLTPTDTVVVVKEPPVPSHDVVFTYMGNGNALRVGSEIIQYGEVRREPPYGFGQCRRGAFGSTPAAHTDGDQVDYLQQRYLAFYPEPRSPLAEELAGRIARVFNEGRLDQIYFDGSEGMMSRYGIDFMRHAIFARLDGDPLVEASCHGAHNWWFHSRLGAWDHPVWAAKRFHDLHVASAARHRASDLLSPQMGWWAPRGPTAQARGHFLDEMEYFAAKNLGLDAAMSLQGVNVSRRPLGYHVERQFTALGWYEALRRARYFDTTTVARVAVPGDEFRLRQSAEGIWQFTPVKPFEHRVTMPGDDAFLVDNPFAGQSLGARIEALYAAAPYGDARRVVLADQAAGLPCQTTTRGPEVTIKAETGAAGRAPDERALHLRAANSGETARGAWARAGLAFAAPYRNLAGAGALGLWVKGDGSGALLNVQLATPREYMHALSDHYVTLDFTGWRYVELLARERDVERMGDHVWPYGGTYDFHRNPLDFAHISELNFYLNEIPPGREVDVSLGPVIALPVRSVTWTNPALTVNGRRLVAPVTMKSGEFLELTPDGTCELYSDAGDPLACVRAVDVARWPLLAPGRNAVRVEAEVPAGHAARAEVTVFTLGEAFGSSNPRRFVDSGRLSREYEMPRWIAASGGPDNSWTVAVRPGETAALEFELTGAMVAPVLGVNGREFAMDVTLSAGQRLFCCDGRNWQVLDAARKTAATGRLPANLPGLHAGPNRITFSCRDPRGAVVHLVKVYR